ARRALILSTMPKREDNELITRVGPGTPMGNFMREYWVPAMLSSELPTPDSDPLRVMLLGGGLSASRDSTATLGPLQRNVQQRGGWPVAGRTEEPALRCG